MKAFPIHTTETDHQGMDLRDYFAAQAMQAIIAKMPLVTTTSEDPPEERDAIIAVHLAVANGAYNYANAMMVMRQYVQEEDNEEDSN